MTSTLPKPTASNLMAHTFAGLQVGAGGHDEVFEYVTGFAASSAVAIVLGGDAGGTLEGVSVGDVAQRLAEVFGVRKADAARLLGVSESTVSRQSRPSVDVLDRTLTASEVFASVAAVLGPDGARIWFRTPSAVLGGHAPLDLLCTRTGEKQVQGVVEALLNGAFL